MVFCKYNQLRNGSTQKKDFQVFQPRFDIRENEMSKKSPWLSRWVGNVGGNITEQLYEERFTRDTHDLSNMLITFFMNRVGNLYALEHVVDVSKNIPLLKLFDLLINNRALAVYRVVVGIYLYTMCCAFTARVKSKF